MQSDCWTSLFPRLQHVSPLAPTPGRRRPPGPLAHRPFCPPLAPRHSPPPLAPPSATGVTGPGWESQRFESLWDEITLFIDINKQKEKLHENFDLDVRTQRKAAMLCSKSWSQRVPRRRDSAAWRRSLTPDVAKGQHDKRRENGGLNGGKLSTVTDCDSSPQKEMVYLLFLSMTVMARWWSVKFVENWPSTWQKKKEILR